MFLSRSWLCRGFRLAIWAALVSGLAFALPQATAQQIDRRDQPPGINLNDHGKRPVLVVGAIHKVIGLNRGELDCSDGQPDRCVVRGGASFVFGRKIDLRSGATAPQPFTLEPLQMVVPPHGARGSRDTFGAAALLGDFDNDGRVELVVGSPGGGREPDASRPGEVHYYQFLRGRFEHAQRLRKGPGQRLGRPGFHGLALEAFDVNDDGFVDLFAGSFEHPVESGIGNGSVFLYRHRGTVNLPPQFHFAPNPSRFDSADLIGSGNQRGFGISLAAGDFNGDGITDLVVGAATARQNPNVEGGALFEFHGDGTGLAGVRRIDQSAYSLPEAGERFGDVLHAVDFDGDGFDDLFASALNEGFGPELPGAGIVFFYRGGPDGLTVDSVIDPRELPGGANADMRFGASLASGDFDGDGVMEVAVGAPRDRVSGPMTQPPGVRDLARRELRSALESASALCGQDGTRPGSGGPVHSELCRARTGASGGTGRRIRRPPMAGTVHIYRHTESGWQRVVTLGNGPEWQKEQELGKAVAAGDLDGDDIDDLVVGAPMRSIETGKASGGVLVFRGGPDGFQQPVELSQTGLAENEDGDGFGASLTLLRRFPGQE